MEKGCPNCGRMLESSSQKCPYCNYDFSEINKMFKHYEEEVEFKMPKYAGFIKRTAATMIDTLLFTVIFLIIEAIYYYFMQTRLDFTKASSLYLAYLPLILILPSYFLYCVICQSSKSMATLGERFLGIEIVDDLNSPLTFGLSFKRNLARLLNALTLGIGSLMIIFTKNKQSLSDIATKTFAINKVTDEKYGSGYAHLFRRSFAFVFDIVLLLGIAWLCNYGINYVDSLKLDFGQDLNKFLIILTGLIIILYFPYTDSHGTSAGKSFMKIKVTNLEGKKISFFKSLIRFVCFFIELLMIPFGTLLAFVTPRKQTFKDLLTKTVVIRNN